MDSEDEDLTFSQRVQKMKLQMKKEKKKAAPEPKDKSETISKLYYDEESGYQSKARTYQMAHA
jgi:hypothetical protein